MQKNLMATLAQQLLQYGPVVAAKPLTLVPFSFKARILEKLLNQLMATQIEDEELEFLSERWVEINITDMQLSFQVSFETQFMIREMGSAEVIFSGETKELLLIAAGKEDPDTLFFQRKLSIEGDTELGLEVKNLLLSIEFDTMPSLVRDSIERLAAMVMQLQTKADTKWA